MKPEPEKHEGPFGYHRDYGLPDAYRLHILNVATRYGLRMAAHTYNVHPSTIHRWMRDKKST